MLESIPIETFEDHIDEVILERGKNYIKSGAVHMIKQSKSYVEAKCEGTDRYTVTMELENKEVIDHECNCPFEYGPFCKHKAAVLYLIRDSLQIRESRYLEEHPHELKKKGISVDRLVKQLSKEEQERLIKNWTDKYFVLQKELVEFVTKKGISD